MADHTESLQAYQERIGYRFVDIDHLRAALTHASCTDQRRYSNERLEFLGDAVLGLVVVHALYDRLPEALEGELTKIKSAVVSRRTCARVASQLRLTDGLVVGQGMDSGDELPRSLAAATFEAVIGAIYVDGGLDPARDFILTHMAGEIDAAASSDHQYNFKSQLQQYAQRVFNSTPQYDLLDEKGPDHCKCFEVAVAIGSRQFPGAWGTSKKEAEQKAARTALVELGELTEDTEELAL